MTARQILQTAEKFLVNNSPGILTGLGVAGTVTTAVLTGKAAYSAALKLSLRDPEVELSTNERVSLVWKEFIPPAAVGVVTIVAIIGANQIGSRRAAAFAAAFKLSEQLSDDYKKKVVETLGLKNEEKMRSELAAEKIKAAPNSGMIVVSGSEVLMYDDLSGRAFKGKLEDVKKAVNEINHQVNNYFHASLTDFYDKIGLTATSFSDSIGWNSDELMDVQYTSTMFEDQPAIMIGYNNEPIKGFERCQ